MSKEFYYAYEEGGDRPVKRSSVSETLNPIEPLTVYVGADKDYTQIDDVFQDYLYYKDPVKIIVNENHTETKPIVLKGGDYSNFTIDTASSTFNGKRIFVDDTEIFNLLNSTSDEKYTDIIILAADHDSRYPYFTLIDAVGPRILAQFERVSPLSDNSIGMLLAFGSKITIGDLTNGIVTDNSGFTKFGKNNILAILGSTVILGENAFIQNAGADNGNATVYVDETGGIGNNIALLQGSKLVAGWYTGAGAAIDGATNVGLVMYGSTASLGPSIYFNFFAGNTTNDVIANNGSIVQADNTLLGTSIIDASSALFASSGANISSTTNNGFGTPTV